MSKSDWVCVLVGVSALACGSVSYVQRPLTRAQAEMLSEAAAGKPVSVELIPMPSSSRSAMVPPDVQSDAASSSSFKVDELTKPIVLQHVRFDVDSIEGASASGPRTLPIAAVRAVTWPGRRLWARGLGVGALLGGVLGATIGAALTPSCPKDGGLCFHGVDTAAHGVAGLLAGIVVGGVLGAVIGWISTSEERKEFLPEK